MKRFIHLVGFITVVLLLGSVAKADGVPVDPTMGVSDPACSGDGCPSIVAAGQGFQFTTVTGGGVFEGTNQTGVTWDSLDIALSGPTVAAGTVTCIATGLYDCNVSSAGGFVTGISFNDDCEGCAGIPTNETFLIDLNSTNGSWPIDEMFKGTYNGTTTTDYVTLTPVVPAPEPGTITLLGMGLVALIAKRKL